MRRDLAFLEDIIAAADKMGEFVHDRDLEYLLTSELLQSAIAHQFTVIGEAAARVTSELRQRHPSIPWTVAKAMRNIVVHHYFGIDWLEAWKTATIDIPILRRQVAEVLEIEFPGSDAKLES